MENFKKKILQASCSQKEGYFKNWRRIGLYMNNVLAQCLVSCRVSEEGWVGAEEILFPNEEI